MKLSLRSVLSFVTFATALSLVPAAAFAQEGPSQPVQGKHMRHHKGHKAGLVGAALKLDSITPEQRTQIEGLVQARKVAQVPALRQGRRAGADGAGAAGAESGKSDPQALGPSLAVERTAAAGAARVDQATFVQLHSILTPAQRAQLVDRMEARTAKFAERKGEGVREHKAKGEGGFGRLGLTQEQKAQIHANLEASRPERPVRGEKGGMKAALESFRGDSFSAPSMERAQNKGMREVRVTTAMIPVLTPNQRATVAAHLRAARDARKGKV